MNVESLLFIFLKAVPWSVQSCAPSPTSAESRQLLISMCPPQHSAPCWRLTCTICWRVWVLAMRVCVECCRCSLASCGCPQVRHPIGSYRGLLQELASQLLGYMAGCCDPYTIAVSTHPFSLLVMCLQTANPLSVLGGAGQKWASWPVSHKAGETRLLTSLSLSPLGEVTGHLGEGVMWVKRNCCSYPLQCICSQMFLLQKGTGTFLLDSWTPIKVFLSMVVVSVWVCSLESPILPPYWCHSPLLSHYWT